MPCATPLEIAVLTVSDTRTAASDRSGKYLADALTEAGHRLHDHAIVRDNIYQIRATVSAWIADPVVDVILLTGGTGLAERDRTPEAVAPLLDKRIDGFGELFRQLSHAEIGASTVQSRALAGLANRTLICCLPGSPGACNTAWEGILRTQMDSTHRPCNFVVALGGEADPEDLIYD